MKCPKLAHTVILALLGAAQILHAQPPTVIAIDAFSGVQMALGMASADDGSGRMFVVQQSGEIMVWNGGASVLPNPFLDLSTLVTDGNEQGLLGLAFHPDYSSNGLFYVNYTDLAGDTVVARYSVSTADPNLADPSSALQILAFDQEAQNHNGGDLHFGPDGYLYISSGDGGADWDNGQNVDNLLGKLLRIDVDGDDFPADPLRNYSLPPDNPLVGLPGRDEIWNLGLRNPWRFSFDRDTGDLFIGDVGDGEWEEIDFAPAPHGGLNWGWPCYEGDAAFQTLGCEVQESYDFPILTLPHDPFPDNNCSIIGGYRYRGSQFPNLRGWYLYADWCTGVLWAAEPVGSGAWDSYPVADLGTFSATGFAEDEDGEIFVAGTWRIQRLVDPTGAIFNDGFESGDTESWSFATTFSTP